MYQQGVYWCCITGTRFAETSNGNPQLVISFNVLGREDPPTSGEVVVDCPRDERHVFRVITDKTVPYLAKDLETLGYNGPLSGLDPVDPGFHDLTGKEFWCRCEHQEYEGQARERWQVAWPEGALQVKPLARDQVRKLDAMFGKKLKEHLAGDEYSQPQSIADQHPEEVGAEDRPF